MQKDISLFFQIVQSPNLLLKYKDNEVIKTYCKLVTDNFITFPKIDIKDLKYHGYPKDNYQTDRYNNFTTTILPSILKATQEKQKELMCEFLESCHGDDSTRDDKNNIHQPEYLFYYHIFTKSKCIPFNIIYKAYPELKQEIKNVEYPCIGYKIPTGTIIEIEHKEGMTRFNDIQNSKILLDFLKIPYRRTFKATIVISPRWYKDDLQYYKNRNAKWQEMRISGFKPDELKVFVLSCSITKKWFRDILENAGIKVANLNPIQIENDSDFKNGLIEIAQKHFRAMLINNDIYVVKVTNGKYIKVEGEIPSTDYPYDLKRFNIHYSYVPVTRIEDEREDA